jgi:hypothetical protein
MRTSTGVIKIVAGVVIEMRPPETGDRVIVLPPLTVNRRRKVTLEIGVGPSGRTVIRLGI